MEPAAFRTPAGDPVPAVTAAEMRDVDRIATEEVGLALLSMMENAGRNLARTVRQSDPERVTVVAGNGGNGGGGLTAARHLANRGDSVSVVLDREPSALTGAAARQFGILDAMGVAVEPSIDAADPDLVVDALVGYGLTGALRGAATDLAEAVNNAPRVVSLDVPSGVDATTGERNGVAVQPDLTLTLALPKTGLDGVGDLLLADIAIPAVVYERAGLAHESPFEDDDTVELL